MAIPFRRACAPPFFLLAACCGYAWSADITGTIVGTVNDPTGAKVQGAKVDIFSTERNRSERTLVSDADGTFRQRCCRLESTASELKPMVLKRFRSTTLP